MIHYYYELADEIAESWGDVGDGNIEAKVRRSIGNDAWVNKVLLAAIYRLLKKQLTHMEHLSRPERMRVAKEQGEREEMRRVKIGVLLERCAYKLEMLPNYNKKGATSCLRFLHQLQFNYIFDTDADSFKTISYFVRNPVKHWIKVSRVKLTPAFKKNLTFMMKKEQP